MSVCVCVSECVRVCVRERECVCAIIYMCSLQTNNSSMTSSRFLTRIV